MELETAVAAPAQDAPIVEATPPAPELNPLQQAVAADDLAAFREQKRAGAKIDDAPPVKEAPAAPVEKPVERTISKRQEQINTYERTIAEQRAELARLQAALAPPAASTQADDPEPDATDTTKYPDGQYDPKFIKDLGAHAARTTYKAQQQADAQTRAETARSQTFADRDRAFNGRLAQAKEADPAFMDKLSDDVRALRPLAYFNEAGKLVQVEQPTVHNAIAEEILRSEHPSALMLHLSQHPDALQTLATSRTHADLVRAITRLEDSLTREAVTPPKTVSSAPPPATVLGTRPTDGADPIRAAVIQDDFRAFRAAKQAKAAAAHR